MNTDHISHQFVKLGARFHVVRPDEVPRHRRRADYALNISSDRRGQFFELQVSSERERQLELQILQCTRQNRHLLLLVKSPEAKDRFLCGHDEREWFVAAVPGGASSVVQAKLALQPIEVQRAGDRAGLNHHKRTSRHNRAFIRQGEWFFIPEPSLQVSSGLILHNEPINRGGGKPHWVAQVYRSGGELVRVCDRHPNGLSEDEYQKLLFSTPTARYWNWRQRMRNAGVYARGTVRHRDHATIKLHHWHRVLMNTESATRQMANVAFID